MGKTIPKLYVGNNMPKSWDCRNRISVICERFDQKWKNNNFLKIYLNLSPWWMHRKYLETTAIRNLTALSFCGAVSFKVTTFEIAIIYIMFFIRGRLKYIICIFFKFFRMAIAKEYIFCSVFFSSSIFFFFSKYKLKSFSHSNIFEANYIFISTMPM